MSIKDDLRDTYWAGYNACLNDLQEAIFNASWWDNQDEDVVWELIQNLRKIGG